MNGRISQTDTNVEPRFLDVKGLQQYLSMGRNRAVEYAKEHGAARHIGRRLLFDVKVLDAALDEMEG